jgi:hypothetical protein
VGVGDFVKPEILFVVSTPLGFRFRCTVPYWAFIIVQKHPSLDGKERDIEQVLADPDKVRLSRRDEEVYLFYRRERDRWLCAIAKREAERGFLITAYPTDTVKAGVEIWTK